MRSAELRTEGPAIANGDLSSHSALRTPHSALLLFEQVSKWYGPVLGLNQVTLELRGGITGLVGANGAGKSTLMKLATGQVRAHARPRHDSGRRRLELAGSSARRLLPGRRRVLRRHDRP